MIYILMSFYEGCGLANYRIVECENEGDLYDECVDFERECGRLNIGGRIGILDLDEFNKIKKEIKQKKEKTKQKKE